MLQEVGPFALLTPKQRRKYSPWPQQDLQEGEDAIENDDDVDEDTAEYDNDDDGMVTGNDFDPFDSDED